jgi:hypothetical protein
MQNTNRTPSINKTKQIGAQKQLTTLSLVIQNEFTGNK